MSADQLLPHHFVATSIVKGMVCDVCHKGFTGFMKHSLRCTGMSIPQHTVKLYDCVIATFEVLFYSLIC